MVRNCAWNGKIYGHIRTLINTYKVINNNMLILHSLICVIMYWMNMKDFDRKIARTLGAGGGVLSLTRLGGGNINFNPFTQLFNSTVLLFFTALKTMRESRMWLFRLSMSWIVALNPLVLAKDFHLSFIFFSC